MNRHRRLPLYLLYLLFTPTHVVSFGVLPVLVQQQQYVTTATVLFSEPPQNRGGGGGEKYVILDSTLTPERVKSLFAWVSRAFTGEPKYNNLMLGMAAIFGTNLSPGSELLQMAKEANSQLPSSEEALMGEPISLMDRQQSSLGAMGAGQWMGQYRTRPHALLDVRNLTSVDDWKQSLPRGCKRTLKKANAQNFTVTTRPIRGGQPAPHSSVAHFRCVVEHEVRLIARDETDTEGFLEALSTAVSRYIGTTRMVGEIQEYRNADGVVIAFAHEVRKGRAIRGQWFYASDEASQSYVWFHSVQELVRRAVEADTVDTADLGPSGSDAFSQLKSKYGFTSVVDWPRVADYKGPFYYDDDDENDVKSGINRFLTTNLLRIMGE